MENSSCKDNFQSHSSKNRSLYAVTDEDTEDTVVKEPCISSRRGSLGRNPIKMPSLSMIERRISTDLFDITGKMEGLKPISNLVRDLNKETSHYRHLAVGLGGSSDCEQLREELRRSRQHSTDLAKQAKAKLLPCLQDPNKCSSAERKEAKRLCKLLYYCIKVLEQELERTLALQHAFALQSQNIFINTGVNEYIAGHKAPLLGHRESLSSFKGVYHHPKDNAGTRTGIRESLTSHRFSLTGHKDTPKKSDANVFKKLTVDQNEVNALHKEAFELWSLLHKSDSHPVVKCLSMAEGGDRTFVLQTIVEDSDPSSNPASPRELDNSDQESLTPSTRTKLRYRRCLCWMLLCLVITGLIAATVGPIVAAVTS